LSFPLIESRKGALDIGKPAQDQTPNRKERENKANAEKETPSAQRTIAVCIERIRQKVFDAIHGAISDEVAQDVL